MTTIMELKKIAKQKRITYEKLSQISKVPISTIKSIFNGSTKSPRIDTIQKLECALGIGWTDEELASGIVPRVVRNVEPDEDELLELYRELRLKKGVKAQETILKLLENMLSM